MIFRLLLKIDDKQGRTIRKSIPEFSSDDAEFILEVVDQYLALIEGTDEEKKKIWT